MPIVKFFEKKRVEGIVVLGKSCNFAPLVRKGKINN